MDIVILYMLILSVSFFCAGIFRKRFEDTLPLAFIFIMLSLFLFGLVDQLKFGIFFVIFSLGCLYIATICFICIKHNGKELIFNFFTAPFFIFTVLFVTCLYINYGKLADSWDEFSHWMDCVKAMSSLDHFVTSRESHSNFQSYPPAMALLQYFSQKIFLYVHKGAEFNEWRMYLIYQLFVLSMFFPFFRNLTIKKPIEFIIFSCILFLLPLVFFHGLYTEIWIDPFVAILAGCGFARVLYKEKDDVSYHLYMIGICITLVLAKDIGLFFGLFIGIAYAADMLIRKNEVFEKTQILARGGGSTFRKSILTNYCIKCR